MKRNMADLFSVPPLTFCVRGEAFLWEEFRNTFHEQQVALPESRDELSTIIYRFFEGLTGHSVLEEEHFYIEKYSHGGMSSGYIEPECWRDGGRIYEHISRSYYRAMEADSRVLQTNP